MVSSRCAPWRRSSAPGQPYGASAFSPTGSRVSIAGTTAASEERTTVAGLFNLLRSRDRDDRVERAIRDGERYLRERQWVAAERAFDFAALQNPDDPRPYLGLALMHH